MAAFASSNLGDVTPNIMGPYCLNTGEKCDYLNSSCPIGGVGHHFTFYYTDFSTPLDQTLIFDTLSHFFWMVPDTLSTDAKIMNKLSVETLLTTIYC